MRARDDKESVLLLDRGYLLLGGHTRVIGKHAQRVQAQRQSTVVVFSTSSSSAALIAYIPSFLGGANKGVGD